MCCNGCNMKLQNSCAPIVHHTLKSSVEAGLMTPKLYSHYKTTKRLNAIVRAVADYGIYRSRPYVMELYRLGYTSQQIANLIHSSRQAVEQDYPREEIL